MVAISRNLVPNPNELTVGSNKKREPGASPLPVLVRTNSQLVRIWHEITAYGHHLPSPHSTFWLNLDLTSGQMWKECHHRNLRSKWPVSMCHTMLVLYFHSAYLTLTCDLTSARTPYFCGIFIIPSEALLHSLGSQWYLVWSRQPIRRKTPALTFELILNRRLILSDFFFQRTLQSMRWELSVGRLVCLDLPISSEVRRRGAKYPSPSANGRCLEIPAPRQIIWLRE